MRKRNKLFILVMLIIVLVCLLNYQYVPDKEIYQENYIAANETIEVDNWLDLNSAIHHEYETIILKEGTYDVTKTIYVEYNVTIIPEDGANVVMVRNSEFTGNVFELKRATITLGSNNGTITIDSNNIEGCKRIFYVKEAIVTMNNLTLKNNIYESSNGGAIDLQDGSNLTLNNSLVTHNKGHKGGGIYVDAESTATINGSTISYNEATTSSGGGIHAKGPITINDSIIEGNKAYTDGGGLTLKEDSTINNTQVINNESNEESGGIEVSKKLTMHGGKITGNKCNYDGCGVRFKDAEFVNDGVLIKDNINVFDDAESNYYPDYSAPNNIDWTQDKSLKLQKITPDLVFEFATDETGLMNPYLGELQGFTITDKFIVFANWHSERDNALFVLNKKTHTLVNVIDDLGIYYVNDMAWDDKTGYTYLVDQTNETPEKYNLIKFKINDAGEVEDLTVRELPKATSGIAIDDDNNHIITYGSRKIRIYDQELNELSKFDTPTKLTSQGIDYYDGHIYFTAFEYGDQTGFNSSSRIYNIKEAYSNIVYDYDLEGNLLRTLYIPNTLVKGELESIEFDEGKNFYMMFNSYGHSKIMIYKDSIPDFVLLSNSEEENSNNVNPETLTGLSVLMLIGILIVLLVFNFINYKKVKV